MKAATRTARLGLILLLAMSSPTVDAGAEHVAVHEGSGRAIEWMPPADFYPQYIADPLRPQSALKILYMTDSEIPETGSSRFGLHLGGRFGLVRWHPEGQPDRGWQLDFEGGFFGQFDMANSLDNIGWDGLFGLYLSWLPSPDLGLRVGTKHDSAHVGDEYSERTGRPRIGYTREELVAGVSWRPAPKWRIYAEGGFGYGLDEFQDPGRLQAGAEIFGARRFWKERMSWYAAVDLQSYQENDWSVRSAIQLGFMLPTGRGTSRYRLALELIHGRSVMGEFAFRDETSVGVGWYFDF
jgi:Protein of unknown function (DUF1207)